MSLPIIEALNLGKTYQLGAIGATRLIDDVNRIWSRTLGREEATRTTLFHALRDVSFAIPQGDVVGIIGRNGAGKSTLLKVLSRITEPSSGELILRGRVASLLEVGTGFVPDLTGRENVFLNGAILGMTRDEIRRRFDEIVEFAEIGQFIDTPVKRYSSGMYVRLAFAVAAHLEPEILIVDEVLAVGDAEFQKKCLGKMGDVSSEGRTIIFVSHNIAAVQLLCRHGILLEDGVVAADGPVQAVLDRYYQAVGKSEASISWAFGDKSSPHDDGVQMRGVAVVAANAREHAALTMQTDLVVETRFCMYGPERPVNITFRVVNEHGVVVCTMQSDARAYPEGEHLGTFQIPGGLLSSGSYVLNLRILRDENEVTVERNDIVSFTIAEDQSHGSARNLREPGVIQPPSSWDVQYLPGQ